LKDKDSYSSLEFRTGVELTLEKLIEHRSADNPEVKWTDFKETVTETVKPRIASNMIDTMNESRKWKAVYTH